MFVSSIKVCNWNIGVVAGKFWRVRRILAQISANLPEKESKENALPYKNDCISMGAMLSNRGSLSTVFAQISPKRPQIFLQLPENN